MNDRVEEFLKRLEVKYGKTSMEGQEVFGVPWSIEGRDFLVLVQVQGDWIWLSAAVLLEAGYQVQGAAILLSCLKTNHAFPELSFDVDENNTLGTSKQVHVDVMKSEVGFTQFKQSFFSIPACIKHFITDLAPAFSLDIPGFHTLVDSFLQKVQE